MAEVGSPWSDELHALRDEVLRQRALTAQERGSRPSVAEWYAGRSVLVTGGSGFLGRVLIEFLLRCCPDVARVYALLRPKKGVSPEARLRGAGGLLDVPLFDRLRAEQPHALDKLQAVAGDVAATGLGLSARDRDTLCAEVSVVFHVAASVRFDDPFRKAVFTNLRSTRDVVELARGMPRLQALVHVSTAYCFIDQNPVGERVYPTPLDWRDVIRWAEQLPDDDAATIDCLEPKLRGFQPNTYTMTKALSERLMEEASADLPVIITRPSIVVGTFTDPMPGWMDNLNGLAAFWAGGFKGFIVVIKGHNITFDTVPVDLVAKLLLLASWAKGLGVEISPRSSTGQRTVDVVNLTVGKLGISMADFRWATLAGGVRYLVPFPHTLRVPDFHIEPSRLRFAFKHFYHHIAFGFVLDLLARLSGVKPRVVALYRRSFEAINATAVFRQQFTFGMENQQKLQCMMHPADEANLDFLDAYSYRDTIDSLRMLFVNSLRGIIRYALKEDDDVKNNLKHFNKVKWAMRVYHTLWLLVAAALLWGGWAFFSATRAVRLSAQAEMLALPSG